MPPMQRPNLFWLALLMLTCCTSATFAQELQVAPGQPKSVNTFGRVEWSIDPGVKYHNPFDPAEVSIDVTFTTPTGSAVTVPAFWSDPAFTVRFAPSEPGNWSFIATVTDPSGRRVSQPRPFSVQPSQRPGFIRRATNNRYLRFDSGQSYFPVGINLCWPPGDAPYASWYDGAFQTLADNGANYVRIWMCTDQAMLESAKTGLGRYDLANAESFDKVLASAEQHGIGVMLCMMNHRELLNRDMWGPAGWPRHPYNAHNGGPATRPIDFFTNPDAQRDFKARLRYIVARYSAYTSVAFWELFNEQEFARVEVPLDWNRQMTDYLRQIDPAKHLITTSAAVPPAVWELPSIDLTQIHIYGDGTQLDMVTPIANSVSDAERFNKPHLVGEMGLDNKGPDIRYDPTGKGTTFHNSLWAGMFSGSAGAGIYWWWDNYVGPKNLWHEFKPVSEFASHIDWAGNHFVPIPITQLWRSDVSDTLADLTILPASAWGATQRQTVTIPVNGRPTAMVPRYLCGPSHGDLHSPLTFELDLPQASELVLGFALVSDCAMVRVSIDGKPMRDFSFRRPARCRQHRKCASLSGESDLSGRCER